MEKINFALESFKNTQELIRFIDQKAGGVLVIAGFLLSIFSKIALELKLTSQFTFIGVVSLILGILITLSLLYLVYLTLFKILKPRLAKNYTSQTCSIYYYEHISNMEKKTLHSKYVALEDSEMLKQIVDQVFEVSKILKEKTINLGKVMDVLWLSIILLTSFIISTSFIG